MRVKTKAIIQEVQVYVADDGTEFNTKAECWDYEVAYVNKPKNRKGRKITYYRIR